MQSSSTALFSPSTMSAFIECRFIDMSYLTKQIDSLYRLVELKLLLLVNQ
jgi:hypothetical protein